jgi:hypothetical protein
VVFEKMAALMGLRYAEWQNTDPTKHFVVSEQYGECPPSSLRRRARPPS